MNLTVIKVIKPCLNLIYGLMKTSKTKDKVLFLSRQGNTKSEDFKMVENMLLEKNPSLETKCICSYLQGTGNESGKKFAFDTLKSMKEMANSKVIVLDSYWPAVSILKKKKNTTVIQMWHAMGKIKQSGYQTLGKESGRDKGLAEVMNMHRGYDYIIASGKAWNPFYVASFDTKEEKLLNYGLPRIDRLLNTCEEKKELVVSTYPELKGKKIILYAPTFRRGIKLDWEPLINEVISNLSSEWVLVVKAHPNQKLELDNSVPKDRVMLCEKLKSEDFLSSAEYVVTDYSAIAVEAAVLNKKTLYFLYDFDEYMSKNGMNIDLFCEMPHSSFRTAKDVVDVIKNNSYDLKDLERYREKFLPEDLGRSTEKIVELILGALNGRI